MQESLKQHANVRFFRVIKDLKGDQYFEASGGACFPGKVPGKNTR